MENSNLNGITVNGKSINKYIEEKEVERKDREIKTEHKQATALPPGAIRGGKVKHKPRAERHGKVRHLTKEDLLKMNLKPALDYKTNQQKVIALLMQSTAPLSQADIHRYLPDINRKSISPIMSAIRAGAGDTGLITTPGLKGKTPTVYHFTDEAKGYGVGQLDDMCIHAANLKRTGFKPKTAKVKLTKSPLKKAVKSVSNKHKMVAPDDGIIQGPPPAPVNDKPTTHQSAIAHTLSQLIEEAGEAINHIPRGVTIEFSVKITSNQ